MSRITGQVRIVGAGLLGASIGHALVMRGVDVILHDAGEHLRNLNVISSPVQDLRDIFDLMPTQTEEHWQNIAARMKAIPASLESYREALSLGASRTMVPASRQIGEVVQQIDALADFGSYYKSHIQRKEP